MRAETDVSLLRIGTELGGRDHSTVLHACDKIDRETPRERGAAARAGRGPGAHLLRLRLEAARRRSRATVAAAATALDRRRRDVTASRAAEPGFQDTALRLRGRLQVVRRHGAEPSPRDLGRPRLDGRAIPVDERGPPSVQRSLRQWESRAADRGLWNMHRRCSPTGSEQADFVDDRRAVHRGRSGRPDVRRCVDAGSCPPSSTP